MHEINYNRDKKEIEYGGIKFDVVRKSNGKIIITENKKTLNFVEPAMYQLGYYLYLLKRAGIESEGYLSCPSKKKRISVKLTEDMEKEIEQRYLEIEKIIEAEFPPNISKCKYCEKCAYNEYCFS